jgi:hypothetical protein
VKIARPLHSEFELAFIGKPAVRPPRVLSRQHINTGFTQKPGHADIDVLIQVKKKGNDR